MCASHLPPTHINKQRTTVAAETLLLADVRESTATDHRIIGATFHVSVQCAVSVRCLRETDVRHRVTDPKTVRSISILADPELSSAMFPREPNFNNVCPALTLSSNNIAGRLQSAFFYAV